MGGFFILRWLYECLTSFLPVQYHRTTRSASTFTFWCNNPRQDQGWVTKKSVGYQCTTKKHWDKVSDQVLREIYHCTASFSHWFEPRHYSLLFICIWVPCLTLFDTHSPAAYRHSQNLGKKGWLILRLQISYILGCYAGYNETIQWYSAGLIS